jgi:hypothetical protein
MQCNAGRVTAVVMQCYTGRVAAVVTQCNTGRVAAVVMQCNTGRVTAVSVCLSVARRCRLSASPFQDVAVSLHILMGRNSALNVSNFVFPCSISGHQQFSFAILCCSACVRSLSWLFKLMEVSLLFEFVCLFVCVCVCM